MSGVNENTEKQTSSGGNWSVKQNLTLISSVLRYGDENWKVLSDTLKKDENPQWKKDWCSEINCKLQYKLLLEKYNIPDYKHPAPRADARVAVEEFPLYNVKQTLTKERINELRASVLIKKDEYIKLVEVLNEFRATAASIGPAEAMYHLLKQQNEFNIKKKNAPGDKDGIQ